jgi:hypothetical protein
VLIGIIKCPTSTLISVVSSKKGPKTFVWTFEILISSGPNVCFKGRGKTTAKKKENEGQKEGQDKQKGEDRALYLQ